MADYSHFLPPSITQYHGTVVQHCAASVPTQKGNPMATFQKRGNVWRAQVRKAGTAPKSKTFPTKAAAKAWADRVEFNVMAVAAGGQIPMRGVTIGDLIDRYNIEIRPIKQWSDTKASCLRVMKREIGDVPVDAMTKQRTLQWAAFRTSKGSGPSTLNGYLIFLGRLLRTARDLWDYEVNVDAVSGARAAMVDNGLIRESNERDRRPEQWELDAIFDFERQRNSRDTIPMNDIAQFAMDTTMRLNEICSIRWDDMNHGERTVLVRNRKHPTQKIGNNMDVALLGASYHIATRQPERSHLIFATNKITVSKRWQYICKQVGVKDLRFHDLRHEGTSRLFEQGYQIPEVAMMTGHRDWKSLKRYAQMKAALLHDGPASKR